MPIYIAGGDDGLDFYEEGTWTPIFTTTGDDYPSITYDAQVGTYTRIGDLVHVQGTISTDLVDLGSPAGDPDWDDVKFLLSAVTNPGASNISSETGDVVEDVAGKWDSDDGYLFDGNDRYNTDLLLPSSNWTIEGWFKPTGGTAYQYMVSSHVGSGTNYGWRAGFISYQSSQKRFYAEIQDSGWETITQANDSSPLNAWYFVRTVYDGSKVEFYVDGTLIGSFNTTSHLGYGLPLRFGGSSSGNHFTGSMSDVRYTTVARTGGTTVPTAAFTASGGSGGDEASGYLQIGGLPYAASSVTNNTCALSVGFAYSWSSGKTPITLRVESNTTKMYLDGMSSSGSTVGWGSILNFDSLATGANSNYLQFGGTYKTTA